MTTAAGCVSALAIVLATAQAVSCAASSASISADDRVDTSFGDPERVRIHGYDGDAMEPFVTRDGRFLIFNSRNDPAVDTDLHYARLSDGTNAQYAGPLQGANSPALDGVPAADRDGNFYFVSTRSYETSGATIYRGILRDGRIDAVTLVEGLPRTRGILLFDVDVSVDGGTMYYASGRFRGGAVPTEADLVIARRTGTAFAPLEDSSRLLQDVNTAGALEYAAAIGGDERELFFTRAAPGAQPQIYRAERANATDPFTTSGRITAIGGRSTEAPALAPDGGTLYYHALDRSRFAIFRVRRMMK